jgi:hypothetical protein
VMRICNYLPTDPPSLHFEPHRLHFERPRPSISAFYASKAPEFCPLMQLDPAFYSNADPDPASKNNRIRIRYPADDTTSACIRYVVPS